MNTFRSAARRHSSSTNLAAALLVAASSSCGLFNTVNRAVHETPAATLDTTKLEADVMHLADSVIRDTGNAGRRLSESIGTPEAHVQALAWSVAHTNHVLSIASNPNPVSALVDLLVFTSVQRMLHEEYWVPEVYHDADQPMLESFRRLEAGCWRATAGVLTDKQQQDLRVLIAGWHDANPNLKAAATLEAPRFDALSKPASGANVPLVSDLFDLLQMDPLANLTPAVREVATTRRLGERIFFFSQHMPRLISQEVELTTLRTTQLPQLRESLAAAQRFTTASEQFVALAAALPDELRVEREALICQLSDEFAAQRAGLLLDLESARGPVQSLLEQSRTTLDAGTRASDSIATLVCSIDSLVARLRDRENRSDAASIPAKPFDVSDYGDAATRIETAAREVNRTLASADADAPKLQGVLEAYAERVERLVDYAYSRALRLASWTGLVALLATLLILGLVRVGRRVRPSRASVEFAEAQRTSRLSRKSP